MISNLEQQGSPVPPEFIGVWKRTLLRTPKIEDATSQVFWMQTRSWHADIRVPASRPACAGKNSLDQLARDDLMALAMQQGFCGTTQIEGDICRWLRQYDFQPPNGSNDIGRMQFDGPDRVLEYGVEADYFEVWERLPGSTGKMVAVRTCRHPLSLLLATGEYAIAIRPRAKNLPIAGNLTTFLRGKCGQAVREVLDFEISFARRVSNGNWRIELSTLPWKERDKIEASFAIEQEDARRFCAIPMSGSQ